MKTEPDGLRFDPDTVTAERITEDADYQYLVTQLVLAYQMGITR
jgi:hypothetical protein